MLRRRPFFVLAFTVGCGFLSAAGRIPWTAAQEYGQGPAASALTFVPATLSVDQGGTASATVAVALRSGKTGGTTLNAWEIPDGVTISFSPDTGTPPFRATMTVTATGSAKSGTYVVKLQATGGDASDVFSYTLTVQKTSGY
jgi:hypothetical protein